MHVFLFFLTGKDKSNKEIALGIHLNNQKQSFKTSLHIPEDDWSHERQRPKNIYLKRYKALNDKLNALKIELAKQLGNPNKPLSQKSVSQTIGRVCKQGIIQPTDSLVYHMQAYIDDKKDLICHSTYKRYKVFLQLIIQFEGYLAEKIYVRRMDTDFVKSFLKFGKQEAYNESTIHRSVHFVKTILNYVEKKGIKTNVKVIELPKKQERLLMVTLSETELQQIQRAPVPVELQSAKDWLVISCYTGQRISDFMLFSEKQLQTIEGKVCLYFTQQKTRKQILLPLHPSILQILRNNGNRFPKKLSALQYNRQIKEIGRISHIDEPVYTNKRGRHRSAIKKTPKWQALSSHVGRRSFATNLYGKIPTPFLVQVTGHSSEQMLIRYINPTNQNHIQPLSKLFDSMSKTAAYNTNL